MINIRMNNVDTHSNLGKKLSPKITVVGVGGAGGNAVNNMISSNLVGVDFVVCNTDAQALVGSLADHKIQLGVGLTEGLGAGAKPEIGRAAAEESLDEVMQYLDQTNMVFITAGMGGGTGTLGASVIAKTCRERGILTVGVVTKPFHFEGTHRMKMAEEGISEMQNYVDTLIVIPNQNLFRVVNEKTTFSDAFKMADSVLQSAVRSVTDLIVMQGLINLDFADIRSVMLEMGKAVIGAGEATGERRATEAAEKAISNPLLDDVSMKGARGVIINVTGGYDMTLFEVDEACNRIRDEIDPNANIIFGSSFDERMEGTMRVSVVATGIDAVVAEKRQKSSSGGFAVERSAAPATVRPAYTPQPAAPASYTSPYPAVPQQVQPQQRAVATAQTQTQMATVAARQVEEAPRYDQQEPAMQAAAPAPAQQYHQQVYQPQPMQQQQQAAQSDAAMRGARVGGSFIPPQPMEPAGGYPQQPQVAQPVMQPAIQRGVAQQAAAPVPQQHYAERKKSASLFERITGQLRSRLQDGHDLLEDAPQAQPPQPQKQAPGMYYPQQDLRAPQRVPQNPAQGRLNIDAPARPAAEEENPLDIPAFLRRQSS
jgi:cell division protein FtsZ